MARVPGVAIREGNMIAGRERKTFASTDGAWIEQEIVEAGGGIEATAVNDSEMQQRSYPDSGGGQSVTGGYEYVRGLGLADHAERDRRGGGRAARRAAVPVRRGSRSSSTRRSSTSRSTSRAATRPSSTACSGPRRSYAGTSFLTTDKLDDGFRYGSDLVDIVADATAPGGMGTFGWDDEGVAAQAVPLVKDGIFVGYLTSRETAPRIGRRSGGAMRADGWNRIPLIRMTNINLLPRPGMSLDEIVADTDDGLLPRVNRSLVDRRPAAELPVRDRGRLRDQGRQEGPAVQEPDLHRHHLRVLAVVRRGRRRAELRDARHAELRQGRAGPDRPRRPRRPRPLPRRPGGGRQVVATRTEVDEPPRPCARSHSTAEATEALFIGQDAALTRFANSQIHQNVREHDAQLQVRVVDRDRVGVATHEPPGRGRDSRRRRAREGHRRALRAEPPRRDHSRARRSRPRPRARIRRRHRRGRRRASRRGGAGRHRRRRGRGAGDGGLVLDAVLSIAVANSNGIRASHRRRAPRS